MRTLTILITALAFIAPGSSRAAEPAQAPPLPRAHAHNDYEHPRPLLDALAHGFLNVEADVYLTPHGLLVAHDLKDVKPDRTLESLYLKPLRARIQSNNGFVLAKDAPFTLLVDIKSDAETTYTAIDALLAQYADILSVTRHGVFQPGPVTIVISGNRPIETMRRQTVRYAGIDGRPGDLRNSPPTSPDLMPWISSRWGDNGSSTPFRWKGEGLMPQAEREQLRAYVQKARQQNRKVRFWATPEKPEFWKELTDAEVDLIGTDKLPALQTFLQTK
ncbi:hypothetical protein Pan44_15380 [Caulifigura coniformis]|uniref:Altered inheritance of mitochondria protein 6 n=1 Tax=Caulifigura coniformis TaxID=2527983 RepID=A0A517SBQ2_9PLAN|nr:phosphatidylinositol-specific phospholipase C/glycerophosphodiester phosphodiesterase family protein [Caulifigura coniformis]QDT53516.1 hypothetical protein Pan44_15380 [Caulifigura coniformis]